MKSPKKSKISHVCTAAALSACFAENTQSCRIIPLYLSCSEVQALLRLDSTFRALVVDLVRVLDFSNWVDDDTVALISERFPRSTKISLQGCFRVTNAIVLALNRLDCLHTLNLRGTQVTDFGNLGSLRNLKELRCNKLRGI